MRNFLPITAAGVVAQSNRLAAKFRVRATLVFKFRIIVRDPRNFIASDTCSRHGGVQVSYHRDQEILSHPRGIVSCRVIEISFESSIHIVVAISSCRESTRVSSTISLSVQIQLVLNYWIVY